MKYVAMYYDYIHGSRKIAEANSKEFIINRVKNYLIAHHRTLIGMYNAGNDILVEFDSKYDFVSIEAV